MYRVFAPQISVLVMLMAAGLSAAPAQTGSPAQMSAESASLSRQLTAYDFLDLPNSADPPVSSAAHTSAVPEQKVTPWQKGGLRIVPYGALWADVNYATERTSPGAFTLFVLSEQEQGEDAFMVDARRTRLGLNIFGPDMHDPLEGKTGGRLEVDFHGNFLTENRAAVLLRHAYWEITNDDFRFLVGQTSDVISPLIPGTLNYGFGYLGGNIGFRRAQVRAERYVNLSSAVQLTLQGSLNQDIVTDFLTEPGIRREAANWPVLQGRTALALRLRGADHDPLTLGVSGHIGETGFDFLANGPPPLNLPPEDDARLRTWSFNVDLRVPLTERCGWQGEYFTGANLSAFGGGIGQGVCPCLRRPIRSTGGWMEIWYDWTNTVHTHAGFGVDDPNNSDSLLGRTRNQFIFTNVLLNVTDNLSTGLEVTYWETLYHEERVGQIPDDQLTSAAPGRAVTVNWMIKYEF